MPTPFNDILQLFNYGEIFAFKLRKFKTSVMNLRGTASAFASPTISLKFLHANGRHCPVIEKRKHRIEELPFETKESADLRYDEVVSRCDGSANRISRFLVILLTTPSHSIKPTKFRRISVKTVMLQRVRNDYEKFCCRITTNKYQMIKMPSSIRNGPANIEF